MKEIATITFTDVETSDETFAIIRSSSDRVALCLSSKSGGDIEVFMNKNDALALCDALKKAI